MASGASLAHHGLGPVYEQNVDAIYAYLARRVGPDVGAELTAQAFVEAVGAWDHFDPARGPVRPWLFGVATNVLRRHRRQEVRRRHALRRLAAHGRPSPGPEDGVVDRVAAHDGQDRIARALAAMPEGERDVLLLHAWTDLTYAEIATALDVPIGTVRSRLSRARSRLTAALGPLVREDRAAPSPRVAAH